MRRRFSLLTLLLLFSCFLSACSNAVRIDGQSLPEFENLFINEIPEEAYDSRYCSDLYVNKAKSILGDPNYVVSFTLQFDDADLFQNHLVQFPAAKTAALASGNETIYLYQWDEKHYLEYTNSKTLDGYFFTCEIIAVNKETHEIRYLFAYVWDYWHDALLIAELSQLYNMVSNK